MAEQETPLPFWFNRSVGLALPFVGMRGQMFDLRDLDCAECCIPRTVFAQRREGGSLYFTIPTADARADETMCAHGKRKALAYDVYHPETAITGVLHESQCYVPRMARENAGNTYPVDTFVLLDPTPSTPIYLPVQ